MDILDIIWRSLTQNSWALALPVFVLGLVYWIITHPDKAQKLADNVLRLLAWVYKHVLNLWRRLKRKIKALKDQKSLNTVMSEVSRQAHSRISKVIIHYVEPSDFPHEVSAMQRNGVVSVTVKDSGDDNLNLLRATLAFLKVALVPNLRDLTIDLTRAMDLVIFMRVLRKQNKQRLCVIFWSSFLPEELKSPEVHDYLQRFTTMEEKGFFSGITLSELQKIDDHPYRQATIVGELDELKMEVTRLFNFIDAIVNRAYGEPTPLEFHGKYVKVAVLLVGRPTTRLYGAKPYISRLIELIQKGVKSVYVVAVGEENTTLTKEISKHNIKDTVMITHLKVFRPAAFNFRPTIVSLLAKTAIA